MPIYKFTPHLVDSLPIVIHSIPIKNKQLVAGLTISQCSSSLKNTGPASQ
jgi:hypothetical protein